MPDGRGTPGRRRRPALDIRSERRKSPLPPASWAKSRLVRYLSLLLRMHSTRG